MIGCYLGAFFFWWLYTVIAFIALSSIFQGIFRPVFQNMMLGNRQDVWVVNGNVSALANLSNIFWPLIGGYMIDLSISPFGLVALLITFAYIYAKRYLYNHVA
jgi:O-antigen/teichoic acid export membrane protein